MQSAVQHKVSDREELASGFRCEECFSLSPLMNSVSPSILDGFVVRSLEKSDILIQSVSFVGMSTIRRIVLRYVEPRLLVATAKTQGLFVKGTLTGKLNTGRASHYSIEERMC